MSSERYHSRRKFLRAAAGLTGAAGVSGTSIAASTATPTEDSAEGSTHTIDMTDTLVFDPDSLTIAPGDTVVWETVGQIGHSVTAYEDGIPDEAAYFASGGFDSEDAARSGYPDKGNVPSGESYSHTFQTEGTYEYFCIPHESAQMIGTIEVSESGGGGEVGGGPPPVPDRAKTLGIATAFGMVGILGLTIGLLKYGGPSQEE